MFISGHFQGQTVV